MTRRSRSPAPIALALALATGSAAVARPDAPATHPAAPPLTFGPELWAGARVGMGRDDVAKLFVGAAPSKVETLNGGARSGLALSRPFDGGPANIQFYFDAGGGLVEIIVDRTDVLARQSKANLAKAHVLADQLSAQYGKAGACTEQDQVAALTCTWVLGEAKAILSYRDVAGAAPALSVSFRKRQDTPTWAPRPVKRLKPR